MAIFFNKRIKVLPGITINKTDNYGFQRLKFES